MNKKISSLLLGFLVTIPTASFAQSANINSQAVRPCVSILNNLRYQVSDFQVGGEVSVLQKFLQAKGYLKTGSTGYFGPLTNQAVKSFQVDNNIIATGYVGPLTRAKVKAISCLDSVSNTNQTTATSVTTDKGPCTGGVLFNTMTGRLCSSATSTTSPISPVVNSTSTLTTSTTSQQQYNSTTTVVATSSVQTATSSNPTASFTINGSHDLSANIGDSITYTWNSTNAKNFSTTIAPSGPNCNYSDLSLHVDTAGGSANKVAPGRSGCSYTITYVASASGSSYAVDTAVLRVGMQYGSSQPASNPQNSGAQFAVSSPTISDVWILGSDHTINFTYPSSVVGKAVNSVVSLVSGDNLTGWRFSDQTILSAPASGQVNWNLLSPTGLGSSVTTGQYKIQVLVMDTTTNANYILSSGVFNVVK